MIFRKPVFFGFLVFVSFLVVTQFLTYQRYLLNDKSEQQDITNAAKAAKERLQGVLDYSLATTSTLSFLIENYGVPQNFDSVAIRLLSSGQFIDAIQVVKGGVITHVYPYKGNENVIGYNILADSTRNKEAFKAIEKKQLYFSGPFELKQGGMGVVGRQPIFKENKFWGFAAVIIKLPTLFRAAALDDKEQNRYIFQLSKINPNTKEEEFYLPKGVTFKKEHFVKVNVPDGEWNLYAQRKKNFALLDLWPLILLGGILSVIGGLFAWYFAKQPQRMAKEVFKKAKELKNSEEKYRQLSEVSPDYIMQYDKEGRHVYMNKAALEISGYTKEQIFGKTHREAGFDPQQSDYWEEKINYVFKTGNTVQEQFEWEGANGIMHLDWRLSPVLDVKGKVVSVLGVSRDITKLINAETELRIKENQLRLFIKYSPAALVMLDTNMNYIDMSSQFAADYGLVLNDIIGKSHYEVFPEIPAAWKRIHQRCLAGATEKKEQEMYVRADGKIEWIKWEIHPWYKSKDEIGGIIIFSALVTEGVKAKSLLEKTIKRYEIAEEQAKLGSWEFIIESKTNSWSKQIFKMFGLIPSELTPSIEEFTALIHPDDIPIIQEAYAQSLSGNVPESKIYRSNPETVGLKYLFATWQIEKDEKGNPVRLYGTTQDITESVITEQQVKDSEAKYRSLIEQASDGIAITNQQGKFIEVNESYCAQLGYSSEELIGMTLWDIIPDEDRSNQPPQLQKLIDGENLIYERRLKRKDGSEFYAEINSKMAANGNLIGFIRDITERKEKNEALHKSLQRNVAFLNTIPDLIFVISKDGRFVDFHNPQNKQTLSSPEDFLGKKVNDVLPLVMAQETLKNIDAVLNNRESIVHQYQMEYADGLHYFEARYAAMNNEEVLAIVRENTKEKHDELMVIESEAKYRTLVEQASDGIIIINQEGEIMNVNNSICRLSGYTEEEIVKKTVYDFVSSEELKDNPFHFDELRMGKTIVTERLMKRKNNKPLQIEVTAKILLDERLLVFIKDVSERKKTETLLAGEKTMLEMVAKDLPLSEVLNTVALNYEAVTDGAISSILLMNEDGTRVKHGAAPNLPNEFNSAIDGLVIGPNHGSCGTAAYKKVQVIVEDIATDPLWINYKELALGFGLKACWSTPILSKNNKVLGTFAIYYKAIKKPTPEDIMLIERASNQVKIVLESYYQETQLVESEEKYRTLVEQASDAIFISDENFNFLEVNSTAISLTGFSFDELKQMSIPKLAFTEEGDEPFIFDELKVGKAIIVQRKIKTKNGKIVPVELSVQKMKNGNYLSFVRDITDRKKNEDKILQLNVELEQKVKERTAELENANADLQEVNDLFVGREARIIELKEELELLKKITSSK